MAVEIDLDESTTAMQKHDDASAADLANGDSIAEQSSAPSTTIEPPAATTVESTPAEAESAEPQVDPELLKKWELDCNEATKQHAISIEQTKALMVELDKQISYKTDELKSIKDEKKGAVERLIRLESRGPEFPPKPQPRKATAATSTEGNATSAGDCSSASTSSPSPEPNEDTSWRQIATTKILDGIERLGKKKLEAIVEAFPTLGDLEDIRGEASKEFVHFAEKLPDGIGKTIADKIEERMMDEIAKYSVGIKPEEQVVLEKAIDQADEYIESISSPADEGVEYEDEADDTDDTEVFDDNDSPSLADV